MTPSAIKARVRRWRKAGKGECMDCRMQTMFNKEGENEYYAVHDEVWLQANPQDSGKLCIGCLEGRLGRTLTPSDFTSAPINHEDTWDQSPRLRSRLRQ
jgi:hypothetical protein